MEEPEAVVCGLYQHFDPMREARRGGSLSLTDFGLFHTTTQEGGIKKTESF